MANIAVAFFYIALPGSDPRIPTLMVKSVRKAMPDAIVYQLSDFDTPEVNGVDYVMSDHLSKEFLMTARLQMYSAYANHHQRVNTVFVDTDIIFQRDVGFIFTDSDFDIALTKRQKVFDITGHNLADSMPFNTGVIFSSLSEGARKFWKATHLICQRMPNGLQRWYGDQEAVAEVASHADTLGISIKQLSHDPYNFTPYSQDTKVSDKYILHFKGDRKERMIAYFKQLEN